MGMQREFVCTACDYRAVVSGGEDVGMICATTTILCETCKKLYDVIVSDYRSGRSEIAPRCPRAKRHVWRLWKQPGPCPRCNALMTVDEAGECVLWD